MQRSDYEIEFLRGFGFQLDRSSLIPQQIVPLQKILTILSRPASSSRKNLIKVYLDSDLLFTYPGPKIALAVVIICINSLEKDEEDLISYLGADVHKSYLLKPSLDGTLLHRTIQSVLNRHHDAKSNVRLLYYRPHLNYLA